MNSNNILCVYFPLFSSKAKPFKRFFIIPQNNTALFVKDSEIILSCDITLFSGEAHPFDSFLVILRNTIS